VYRIIKERPNGSVYEVKKETDEELVAHIRAT
jgi:hypothetical protein